MLKHLWEQDRKQKELLKRAYKFMNSALSTAPLFDEEKEVMNELFAEIMEAIKA